MPLYELIVITRCGEARNTANFFRQVALSIFAAGGNVRELKVLGDRILTRQVKGNDEKDHLVGRYCQILYDGGLECKAKAENSAVESYETIRYQTFKIKDFFSDASMFRKALRQKSPIIDESIKKRRFINELLNIVENKK